MPVVERQGGILRIPERQLHVQVCRESGAGRHLRDAPGEETQGELEDSLLLSSEQLAETDVVRDESRDDAQSSTSTRDTTEGGSKSENGPKTTRRLDILDCVVEVTDSKQEEGDSKTSKERDKRNVLAEGCDTVEEITSISQDLRAIDAKTPRTGRRRSPRTR